MSDILTFDDFKLQVLCFLSEDITDYIWVSRGFHIAQRTLPFPHMYGRIDIDDSIVDEWFIVHLVRVI